MSGKKLVCAICGREYDGCRTCKTHDLASWKTVCDTENHFNIFVILHKYNVLKKITKEQAAAALSALKMPAKIQEHIHKDIKSIFGVKGDLT